MGLTYGITTSSDDQRRTFGLVSQNFINLRSHILRYTIWVGLPMYFDGLVGLNDPLYAIHKYVAISQRNLLK